MNLKRFFSLSAFFIFFVIFFYLNWIIWILNFIVSIWFYTILFYTFHIIWRKIFSKEIIDPIVYMENFAFRISIFLIITISFFSSLAYLSNEIYKAKMPEYTISNWEKTVKFQAMVHIWSKKYYEEVINNLKTFKENWWVYFFEWVKTGSEENMQAFNNAIWVEFDQDLYKNFSKLYWVTFQDTSLFLGLVNNLDFNVDLSVDEIIKLYEEKNIQKNIEKKYNTPIDANKEILKTLSTLNERELKILVYLNQAILNLIIGSDDVQWMLSNKFTNKELFEVILDERNKILVNEIQKSEYDKIYITYWLLHFKWVLEELKKQDPKWKIIETKYLYPID